MWVNFDVGKGIIIEVLYTNLSISFCLVKECVDHLSRDEDEEKLVASLWGAERCLRVLESVSMDNGMRELFLIVIICTYNHLILYIPWSCTRFSELKLQGLFSQPIVSK